MLVDEYEQFQNDRTDDVVVSQSGSEELDAEPSADDCKGLPTTPFSSRRWHIYPARIYGCSDKSPQQLYAGDL